MVSMQGLAIQRLPHDIPPEAARDYAHTGWDGKLDIDGSELYEYTADFGRLTVRIREDFYDEPNDDYTEDDPERYIIDKSLSYWKRRVLLLRRAGTVWPGRKPPPGPRRQPPRGQRGVHLLPQRAVSRRGLAAASYEGAIRMVARRLHLPGSHLAGMDRKLPTGSRQGSAADLAVTSLPLIDIHPTSVGIRKGLERHRPDN